MTTSRASYATTDRSADSPARVEIDRATEDPTRGSVQSAMTTTSTPTPSVADLTAVEIDALRLCAADTCSVRGGFQTDFPTPAHLVAARRLCRVGLVEWRMPREGFPGGYAASDPGRALLAAAKGGA